MTRKEIRKRDIVARYNIDCTACGIPRYHIGIRIISSGLQVSICRECCKFIAKNYQRLIGERKVQEILEE